jgi:hypothetical protein
MRGDASGWSRNVARRNCDFLMSVQADGLDGVGFALSLTIKDCPDTPQAWKDLRERYRARLVRMGLVRMHWLTEWQRRGVPHMHAAVWFAAPIELEGLRWHWLQAAAQYRPGPLAQDVRPLRGSVGWFEYLAKHASRSVSNYQRSNASIPEQWRGKTGRMWGHLGEWPVSEVKELELDSQAWCQYRRLVIGYQVGKARRQGDDSRVRYLRRYRSKAPKLTSGVQALPRVWMPEDDQWALVASALASHG